MRLAYFALSVDLSAHHGGTTHVLEVYRGLEALGHEVWVVCSAPSTALPAWVKRIELGRRPWVYLTAWRSTRHVLDKLRPDAIVERYYNFAGQAIFWGARTGTPCLLEVNAPMAAAPGTAKWLMDRISLGQIFTRMARLQADLASGIVTPLATAVPWPTARAKTVELPWGANTHAFRPDLRWAEETMSLRESLSIAPEDRVAVFHGSYRPWHGIDLLVSAIPLLLGLDPRYKVLLVGGGQRLDVARHRLEHFIRQGRVLLTGPVPYHLVPHYVAAGHVSVAPFDLSSHPYLKHFGFYWSPLKVFEAMATGLPVVTVDVHPLNRVVRDGLEGVLFRPGSRAELLAALHRLLSNPELTAELGTRARDRVVQFYSWQHHCQRLNAILEGLAK